MHHPQTETGKGSNMKIKLVEGLTQAQLDEQIDALVKKTKEQTKLNFSEAAERHEKKYNALLSERDNYKELLGNAKEELTKTIGARDDFEKKYTSAAQELDSHQLKTILKNKKVNPKFNDMVIKNYGLHSKLGDKEIDEKIKQLTTDYPEFMINEKQPPKSPEPVQKPDQLVFDKNKTYF